MKKSKAKNMIACLIIVCSLTLFFLPVIVATVQFRNLQFILFNGYNSEQIETSMGTLGITAEVEAYRDLVTEYAIKYEIEDYVDLLLAVIMQESGGIGNDIFQASESLGLSPNTLSVEESIDQGVKVIEDINKCVELYVPQERLREYEQDKQHREDYNKIRKMDIDRSPEINKFKEVELELEA